MSVRNIGHWCAMVGIEPKNLPSAGLYSTAHKTDGRSGVTQVHTFTPKPAITATWELQSMKWEGTERVKLQLP